ncbi:MAG: hypothetical protein ACXVEF_39260 [Polyangiales bacterium]
MKKLLLVAGLVVVGIVGLSFMVALGRFAAYRDNRIKCEDPVDDKATAKLSIELPEGAHVCRMTSRTESASMELSVEPPSALCFLSSGAAFCPSIAKSQLAFMRSMEGAGWDRVESHYKDEVRFAKGKGTYATVRLRQSSYGAVDATMEVDVPSSKVGKQ